MEKNNKQTVTWNSGIGIIETVIGVSVFIVVAVGVYEAYRSMYGFIGVSKQKIVAAALANEQLEIIRNLPFSDVGIVNGIPSGKIPREQTLNRSGTDYQVVTTIRNIDDPFDGTIGGAPNDTSPADYKLAQLDISCSACVSFQSFSVSTYVAPRSLELSTGNGALFINVFNASGDAVPGATVTITNSSVNPAINIQETTDNNGGLQVVDVPPGNAAYQVTVTKNGFSTDETFPATAEKPNPVKPHATVSAQQATQVSFSIDEFSEGQISAVSEECIDQEGTQFKLTSAKLNYSAPDEPKNEITGTTETGGEKTLTDIEWDDYTLEVTQSPLELLKFVPDLPLKLLPASSTKQVIVLDNGEAEPQYSLLISVKDAADGKELTNEVVTLTKETLPVTAVSECAPPDYHLYTDLTNETYHLTVTAEGYENSEQDILITESWQPLEILLNKI